METKKLRVIQDYDKLSTKLQEQVKLVYPEGFVEYLVYYTNVNGELVSALRFETDEKIYMLRMSKSYAKALVSDDDDYNNKGILKSDIKGEYEEKYRDVDYLAENNNYEG
jgi:hypothetical protein